jgi:hypothetical protein
LVQRFPSNPALRAVPSSAQVEEYSVDFTLTGKIPDPPAGHVCYHLGLVRGHPTGIPQYGSRKVSVLAADQARPILDYKPLEDIVQESDFAAWKNTKQVAVKIPKILLKFSAAGSVGSGGSMCLSTSRSGRGHSLSTVTAPRPGLGCKSNVCRGKGPLRLAQFILFTNGADKKYKP